MLRYLELCVTDTILYQFVCWTPKVALFFFVFLRSILCTPCSCLSTSFKCEEDTCILRYVQKEYPICTEKRFFGTSGPQTRTSSAFFVGRLRDCFTLFTHFFHFPSLFFRLFIYSNDCHSTHLCITRRSDDWGEIVPRDVEKKSSRRCRFHRGHPS